MFQLIPHCYIPFLVHPVLSGANRANVAKSWIPIPWQALIHGSESLIMLANALKFIDYY